MYFAATPKLSANDSTYSDDSFIIFSVTYVFNNASSSFFESKYTL